MVLTTIDRTVPSICPICLGKVQAHIFQEGNAVMISKRCPDHGEFQDVYWSDADLYRKFRRFETLGSGLESPARSGGDCPFNCGICKDHLTSTLLANIDLTNRCNLNCPVCFADAAKKRLYEPTFDQIIQMLQILRNERPVPCPAVQFSGGEPTLRQDLPEIISAAKEMGFSQIQVATNGIKLAADDGLCERLSRAGLDTIYLQFDGVTPEVHIASRGKDLLSIKERAIVECRKAGMMSVVLVPTVAKGVNDHELGDIVRFAVRNIDLVKGVNFQPVSFAGRIEEWELKKRRITIPDLLNRLDIQTGGQITKDDFYPVPFVAPISRLIARDRGSQEPVFTVHPCCGAGTYVYYNGSDLIPLTRFIDVEGLLEKIEEAAGELNGSTISRLKVHGILLKELSGFIDEANAPQELNVTRLLISVLKNGTKDSLREFHNKTLFLGIMHFQDLHNIDLERVRSCGIHYIVPDGRIIPFCTYNNIYRQQVEEQFSLSSDHMEEDT